MQLRTFKFFTAMNDSFNHNENAARGGVPGILNRVVSFFARRKCEQVYPRFLRFINEAHRDGVMGEKRYAMALSKARKLNRFLIITGRTAMPVGAFTTEMVLQFRQFVYDEYRYVAQFPALYPRGARHRRPSRQMKNTTVVHDLKLLQAFFAELENTGEISRSPFRRISMEKRRHIMHVMYDAPVFLRADEMKQVLTTTVPPNLQWAKDLFVLNCAIGCRISDLLRLTPDKVATSDDGIPYIHYIPSKTTKLQATNQEVMTPLVEPALEIVNRTHLRLTGPNLRNEQQRYNVALKRLLKYCGITRPVSLYDHHQGDNVYKPLCEVATSKLARKTHIDMLNKVQINYYAAGLHQAGSDAVFRYTNLELKDRYQLLKAAFGV